jgi:hypothetical protein
MTNTPPIDDVKLELTIEDVEPLARCLAQFNHGDELGDEGRKGGMPLWWSYTDEAGAIMRAFPSLRSTPPHADTLSLPTRDTVIEELRSALSATVDAIFEWSRPTGANGMVPICHDHPLCVAAIKGRAALSSTPPESMSTEQGEAREMFSVGKFLEERADEARQKHSECSRNNDSAGAWFNHGLHMAYGCALEEIEKREALKSTPPIPVGEAREEIAREFLADSFAFEGLADQEEWVRTNGGGHGCGYTVALRAIQRALDQRSHESQG